MLVITLIIIAIQPLFYFLFLIAGTKLANNKEIKIPNVIEQIEEKKEQKENKAQNSKIKNLMEEIDNYSGPKG